MDSRYTMQLFKIMRIAPITLLVCICFLGQDALAASSPTSGLNETSSLFSAIMKVAGSLGLVLALMVMLIYFVKKSGLSQGGSGAGSMIKVLDTRMVAQKKYIAIVEIAGKCIAVGITDHNINMLTSLDDTTVTSPSLQESRTLKNQPFATIFNKVKSFKNPSRSFKGQEAKSEN